MSESRISTAYRLLLQHGPLTSIGVAEMMGISRRSASGILSYLAENGGCELIDRVTHPECNTARLHLYQAIAYWNPRRKSDDTADGITAADIAWMNHYRQRAAEKAALRSNAR